MPHHALTLQVATPGCNVQAPKRIYVSVTRYDDLFGTPASVPGTGRCLDLDSPGTNLTEARFHVQWAIQILRTLDRSFGRSDSQGPDWLSNRVAFRIVAVLGNHPVEVLLRVEDLTLIVITPEDQAESELSLQGLTLAEAYSWVGRSLASAIGRRAAIRMGPMTTGLPARVLPGGRFRPTDHAYFRRIGSWLTWTEEVLTSFTAASSAAAAHLSLGDLTYGVTLNIPASGNGDGGTVRAGIAIWGRATSAPYFFARPRTTVALPRTPHPLPIGRWQWDPWFGAVLDSRVLTAEDNGPAQVRLVQHFFRTATEKAVGSLGLTDLGKQEASTRHESESA